MEWRWLINVNFSLTIFFFVYLQICVACCTINNNYLECGIKSGDGNAGGGSIDDDAAASGCRKFRRWSIRSWCCVRHLVISSGNASSCSLIFFFLFLL